MSDATLPNHPRPAYTSRLAAVPDGLNRKSLELLSEILDRRIRTRRPRRGWIVQEIQRSKDSIPASLTWWSHDYVGLELPETEAIVTAPVPTQSEHWLSRRTFVAGHRVIHFYEQSDALWPLDRYNKVSAPGLLEQSVRLTSSGLIETVRTFTTYSLVDFTATLGRTPESDSELAWRLDRLRDVAGTLVELHAANLFHGDLRPENIVQHGRQWMLADWGFRLPTRYLSREQAAYIAPEAVAQENGSPSADCFSFAKLAQRILGSYLWRGQPMSPAQRTLCWGIELALLPSAKSRPSANLLLTWIERALQGARDSRSFLQRTVESHRSPSEVGKTPGQNRLEANLERWPYTGWTIRRRGSQIFEQYLDIDALVSVRQNQNYDKSKRSQKSFMDSRKSIEQDHIDSRWMESAHIRFFGYGSGASHDERIAKLPRSSLQRKLANEFKLYLTDLDEARNGLLESDIFLSDREMIKVLTGTVRQEAAEVDLVALREWGTILAVPDHGRWLYPLFQIRPKDGLPSDLIERASNVLTESTEWDTLAWWNLPRQSLSGGTFASVIHLPEARMYILNALDVIVDSAAQGS